MNLNSFKCQSFYIKVAFLVFIIFLSGAWALEAASGYAATVGRTAVRDGEYGCLP
jgi:hypothetical protein